MQDACADVVCDDGSSCDPDTGECEADDDACGGVFCGGGETCVDGECVTGSSVADPCAGVVCSAGEICVDGMCVVDAAGTDPCSGVVCPDGQTCLEGLCVIIPAGVNNCAGVACLNGEVCVDGLCVLSPAGADPCAGVVCDDGIACTTDTCVDGKCTYAPDSAACADDGLFCNGVEVCHAVQGCISTGDPCAVGEYCDEAAGMCNTSGVPPEGFTLSRNADLSTDDLAYAPSDTIHIQVWTNQVDFNDILVANWELRSGPNAVVLPLANNLDNTYTASFALAGLLSTATDWTFTATVQDNAGGQYQPTADVTVTDAPPAACTTDAECDDGDFCTGVETCDPVLGCVSSGNPCQPGETCVIDTCVAGDPCAGVTCAANETCVNGTCVPNDPCAGVTCNANETCDNGTCVPNDPCAGVTCNAGETCVNGACVVDPVAAGQALYDDWACGVCHGADGLGGSAPPLRGVGATVIFNKIRGQGHPISVPGATQQDADYLAAWFATL